MWVKSKVTGKEWTNYYSHIPGNTYLAQEGNDVWIGFCIQPDMADERHIEILDTDDLLKIQKHREATHTYPLPMEAKK